MASFKACHPKRYNLILARTGGEGQSLYVCAHLRGPWRHVVKKLTFRLIPVRRCGSEEDEDDEDDDARIARFACVGIFA